MGVEFHRHAQVSPIGGWVVGGAHSSAHANPFPLRPLRTELSERARY